MLQDMVVDECFTGPVDGEAGAAGAQAAGVLDGELLDGAGDHGTGDSSARDDVLRGDSVQAEDARGNGAGDETPATVEELGPDQCWQLLAGAEVGRLAVAAAGEVDIFPMNFVVDERTLVFRTAEGTKLVEVVISGRVAFEADGYHPEQGEAWSVVAKGYAELLERSDDVFRAQSLPLFPWSAAPKERFFRLVVTSLTGRRFLVARGARRPSVL